MENTNKTIRKDEGSTQETEMQKTAYTMSLYTKKEIMELFTQNIKPLYIPQGMNKRTKKELLALYEEAFELGLNYPIQHRISKYIEKLEASY